MKSKAAFISASLVKCSNKQWYIKFYQTNPATGERERIRVTYELNRIKNLRERAKRATALVNEINAKLSDGFPFEKEGTAHIRTTPFHECLEMAVKTKSILRKKSVQGYSSKKNILLKWMESVGKKKTPVGQIDAKTIRSFLDYMVLEKKVKARTHNNYILFLSSIFNVMVDKEYIPHNPTTGIKYMKAEQKERKTIGERERKEIISYLKKSEARLYYIVIIIFYTFIRPKEIRMLKVSHFNMKMGTIHIPGYISKNKKNGVVTLPTHAVKVLEGLELEKYPSSSYVFGKNLVTGRLMCGHNTYNNRHRDALDVLVKKGKIESREGISLYSWKDTGGKFQIENGVTVTELQKQMRHKELATTQMYVEQMSDVSRGIRDLKGGIL